MVDLFCKLLAHKNKQSYVVRMSSRVNRGRMQWRVALPRDFVDALGHPRAKLVLDDGGRPRLRFGSEGNIVDRERYRVELTRNNISHLALPLHNTRPVEVAAELCPGGDLVLHELPHIAPAFRGGGAGTAVVRGQNIGLDRIILDKVAPAPEQKWTDLEVREMGELINDMMRLRPDLSMKFFERKVIIERETTSKVRII